MASIQAKITDSILKNVDTDITRISDTELKGFHVRFGKVKKDGSRNGSYYYYYKIGGRGGQEANFKIGSLSSVSVKDARQHAKVLAGQVARSENPQEAKKASMRHKHAERFQPIVKELVNEFVDIYVKQHRKRPEEAIRVFDKDVIPTIGDCYLGSITQRLIITQVLDPIQKRNSRSKNKNTGRIQANKTLSLLKQTFDFGVSRGLIDSNPLATVKRRNIGGEELPKDRFLNEIEIKKLLENLPRSNISPQVQAVIKVLLFTGCRVGEVTLAEWQHIDLQKQVWRFPPENIKSRKANKKWNEVPFSQNTLNVLVETQQQSKGHSDFVFPCAGGQEKLAKPMDKRSVARAIKRHSDALKIEAFTPHDLRRTVQTHMARLRIDGIVIEKVLNHQLVGMARVYNQHDYFEEKRQALLEWNTELKRIAGN